MESFGSDEMLTWGRRPSAQFTDGFGPLAGLPRAGEPSPGIMPEKVSALLQRRVCKISPLPLVQESVNLFCIADEISDIAYDVICIIRRAGYTRRRLD
ncbi:hypothetical protein NL676_038147 [Syzygium grande]|nr:hypothetical protein NL676_038147 [Syzygium grande]